MTEGFIGLGSNLGRRGEHLARGLEGLRAVDLDLLGCSSVWETEPVGPAAGDWFWNMVIHYRTDLEAISLLGHLLQIEERNGRERKVSQGPRTLDLDLLTYGSLEHHDQRLQLPHPRMWERSFVLAPLSEIAPDWIDPVSGRSPSTLLQELAEPSQVRRLGSLASAVDAPL